MLLLPLTNSRGVLVIPEIVLVLGLAQPSPLKLALPGLAAVGLKTVALALSTPVIGKKKFLAVQALLSGARRLHRFQTQKQTAMENQEKQPKKIQPQQDSARRRRKKIFQ
jgi:DNA repair protein RadC